MTRAGLASLLLPLLVACHGGQQEGAADGRTAAPAAKLGAISSNAVLDAFITRETGQSPAQVDGAVRQRLVKEFAGLRSAAAQGAVIGDLGAQAELQRLETLARAAAEAAGVFVEPSEAELQSAYAALVRTLPGREYHAAHILLATEVQAIGAIAELDRGASFADVARLRSADQSRDRGGDLGRIRPGHLPEEIFATLATLRAGGYSNRPVRTVYGWHVLQLLEHRATDAPPLDQVREQLKADVQRQKFHEFLASRAASP